MTLPAYRDVDLALHLELVRAERPLRGTSASEVVARHFPELTAEDRARTRSDGRTKVFDNVVHWSRNHLNVRGLLDQLPAGEWQTNTNARDALVADLTQRGVSTDRAGAFIQGAELLSDLLGKAWPKSLRLKAAGSKNGSVESPTVRGTLAVGDGAAVPTVSPSQHDNRLDMKRALLGRLNVIDPYEFEQLIGRVLDSIGFRDTQVVGKSGDEGVDIITYLHSPFVRAKVAVQVKRHTGNVGPRDISYLRDRWARRSDRLLFVTTSDFTVGAREVANDEHDKQVALVTGDRLADVMINLGLGVRTHPLVTYELDEAYLSGAESSADFAE